MNILILGGVAAGTKTAAKLKREDRSLNVTILTKDKDISYAGCGLPYYVGSLIENREELIVNTPESYAALTGVEVLTGREAISVDSEAKTVVVRCTDTGEEEIHSYDRLVIATGASPAIPPIEGVGKAGAPGPTKNRDAEKAGKPSLPAFRNPQNRGKAPLSLRARERFAILSSNPLDRKGRDNDPRSGYLGRLGGHVPSRVLRPSGLAAVCQPVVWSGQPHLSGRYGGVPPSGGVFL